VEDLIVDIERRSHISSIKHLMRDAVSQAARTTLAPRNISEMPAPPPRHHAIFNLGMQTKTICALAEPGADGGPSPIRTVPSPHA
jgi:hypothetical protein